MSSVLTLPVLMCLMVSQPVVDSTPVAPVREGPTVGFLCHPFLGGMEPLADTGANTELANIFVWRTVEPEPASLEEITVDFGPPETWLREVYRSGRLAYPILDTAIHHSNQPWRAALTRRAGENLTTVAGEEAGFSSLHSPLFRRSVFQYVDDLIAWVQENDPERRVRGYVDGAEWFYPGMLDYSPLACEAFRKWLRARHAGIDRLNSAWGASFASWGDVVPPRAMPVGTIDHGYRTYVFDELIDVAWQSPDVAAMPGHTYAVSVPVVDTTLGYACVAQIVWVDEAGALLHLDSFGWMGGTAITGTADCPDGAARARLVVKLSGPGKARFGPPTLVDRHAGQTRLHGAEPGWTFVEWNGSGTGHRDASGNLTIDTGEATIPFGHTSAALEDWVTFSYEAMADWLDTCARHIKSRDPSRPVTSYLGFIFASHSSWDYAMDMQRIDISLANSPSIDINALQVCAAGNDLTYPAFPVDVARKYGKPVWSYDLVDFPYGLHSGFEPIYRASMASIQHGSRAILYCQWAGPPYDYQYSTCLARTDLDRMMRDVQTAVSALEGLTLETNVAFLLPLMSYSVADEGGRKGDMIDSGGLYHLVLDLGLTPDVYTPYELAKQGPGCLDRYRVVFVPDCPVLPEDAHAVLAGYTAGGGTLLSSGRFPTRDLNGTMHAPVTAAMDFDEPIGRAYWGEVDRLRRHGNTPPVFLAKAPEADRIERDILRDRVARGLLDNGYRWPVRLVRSGGDVHNATYRAEEDPGVTHFLVHKGPGRCVGLQLLVEPSERAGDWEAWIDFDRTERLTPDEHGAMKVPDFAHVCLVRQTL